MIVCSCNVLSDGQIRACLRDGPGCPRTPAQVYGCLGCSAKCGRCARTIRGILQRAVADAASVVAEASCGTTCGTACSLVQFQTTQAGQEVAA